MSILGLIFIYLKVHGDIDWSWGWVALPIIIQALEDFGSLAKKSGK